MANERKTETIVRNHFSKYNDIILEEQKSDNVKITKLLKNASKRGNRHGLPEFIITYPGNANFLIVVECKGDVKKHESSKRDKYSDYAVDGALLYASFLSKEYDVLAIAVSGQTQKELRVSHFLHLKGESKAILKFGNKLLDPESYVEGYLDSPEKKRQDYLSLLTFSKELNDTLQSKKIKEASRSLLISGILIALENKPFELTYKMHPNPEVLANTLVDTITSQLKNANLQAKKLENLKTAFSFIRTHTALSTEKDVLANIIDSINTNINNFRKTHKYFDVLGQLYVEFLRYANSDKGLGIVLTPPHVTELFAEMAGVTKNSVVLDNCTGTGGFLIAGMNKMINDAKDDRKKIALIKEKQLVGVEYQDDIFALACSNMFIHQDGKTNIFHGSCFDEAIMKDIAPFKPNIGLLNPPYPNIDSDPKELEFVLNNLEQLSLGGTCIAIIPMSCVLALKGKDYELKRKLLESHTLEAVLSMPDQVFHNTGVGVVTSVLVITANIPHPEGKKTWFGYFKNDGYTVQKHKGRGDWDEKWMPIKEKWLKAFRNREVINGLSVMAEVDQDDEWCAEAFMKTDYSRITAEDFIQELKKYAAYSIITSE